MKIAMSFTFKPGEVFVHNPSYESRDHVFLKGCELGVAYDVQKYSKHQIKGGGDLHKFLTIKLLSL